MLKVGIFGLDNSGKTTLIAPFIKNKQHISEITPTCVIFLIRDLKLNKSLYQLSLILFT